MIQLPVPIRRELRYTKFHNAESFSSAAFVSLSSFSPIPLIVLHKTNAMLCPYSACYHFYFIPILLQSHFLFCKKKRSGIIFNNLIHYTTNFHFVLNILPYKCQNIVSRSFILFLTKRKEWNHRLHFNYSSSR